METPGAVDTTSITDLVADLTAVAGAVSLAVLAIGALIIGIAVAVGAAIKWGPTLVNKFFKR